MKALRSRDRDSECVFAAPLLRSLPPSVIYRLFFFFFPRSDWGADSFIRWGVGAAAAAGGGGGCFDLKIRTIIAFGVEKVKESACVLIRGRKKDHFFSFSPSFFSQIERKILIQVASGLFPFSLGIPTLRARWSVFPNPLYLFYLSSLEKSPWKTFVNFRAFQNKAGWWLNESSVRNIQSGQVRFSTSCWCEGHLTYITTLWRAAMRLCSV